MQKGRTKSKDGKINIQMVESTNQLHRENSLNDDLEVPSLEAKTSYSRAKQELRIGRQLDISGLPPFHSHVLEMIPVFLYSVVKQMHVIYLLVVGVFQSFIFFCQEGLNLRLQFIQLILIIVYIVIELLKRYYTFKYSTEVPEILNSACEVWHPRLKKWNKIAESQLKVGQIIKISKNNKEAGMELTEDSEGDQKIRTPVNILPLHCSSGQSSVQIDTFDMNKEQNRVKIDIDPRFDSFFPRDLDAQVVGDIHNCQIQYYFSNHIGEIFEAIVKFDHLGEESRITNLDTIPRGAYFCRQEFVIGVVLYNLEKTNTDSLKSLLLTKNTIVESMENHLIYVIVAILLVSVGLVIIKVALQVTIFTDTQTHAQEYLCTFVNYIAVLSFCINVVMFVLLGLHHLLDVWRTSNKCKIKIKNYIKTVDEFGMVEAFVMDDYTLVTKSMLKVTQMDFNRESSVSHQGHFQNNQNPFSMVQHMIQLDDPREPDEWSSTESYIGEETILSVISRSKKFKEKFPWPWLALNARYQEQCSHANHQQIEEPGRFHEEIVIKDETIDMSGAVRVQIIVANKTKKQHPDDPDRPEGDRVFFIRFNDKIIFSLLQSLSFEKKNDFKTKISEGNSNGDLMIMVEIVEIPKEDISISMDISKNNYELGYRFHCLIKMKYSYNLAGAAFIKQIKNKYKVIIMTESSLEYFNKVLVSARLKEVDDYVLVFEETDEGNFSKELQKRVAQMKKNRRRTDIQASSGKTYNDFIIALDSSLIPYLVREHTRESLNLLSSSATYIIFYNTSQFQKQLCTLNIFKIFPKHIFISNFAIDRNIFINSKLSVCISGHSAERFTNMSAQSYQELCRFVTEQSVKSIELTSMIVKSHIFKNQCLIASLVLIMLIQHKGQLLYLHVEFSVYMFYMYNLGFTILPLIYYLWKRPELLPDILVEDYKDYKLKQQHLKGIISGLFLTFVTYSMMPELMGNQIFVTIVINCTIMGNLYHLVLDDSISKKYQLLTIIVQCLFSVGIYFIFQYVPEISHNLFVFGIVMSPFYADRVFYFSVITVFSLYAILLLFYFLSFHKSILIRQIRLSDRNQTWKEGWTSDLGAVNEPMVAKISRGGGKQMRFRYYDAAWMDQF